MHVEKWGILLQIVSRDVRTEKTRLRGSGKAYPTSSPIPVRKSQGCPAEVDSELVKDGLEEYSQSGEVNGRSVTVLRGCGCSRTPVKSDLYHLEPTDQFTVVNGWATVIKAWESCPAWSRDQERGNGQAATVCGELPWRVEVLACV